MKKNFVNSRVPQVASSSEPNMYRPNILNRMWKNAAVEKDVGDELPQIEVLRHQRRHQTELVVNEGAARNPVEYLQKKSDDAGDDQRLDRRRPAAADPKSTKS